MRWVAPQDDANDNEGGGERGDHEIGNIVLYSCLHKLSHVPRSANAKKRPMFPQPPFNSLGVFPPRFFLFALTPASNNQNTKIESQFCFAKWRGVSPAKSKDSSSAIETSPLLE